MGVIAYLKRHDNAWLRAGLLITGIICLFVIASCFYMPYDPTAMDRTAKSLGFSFQHWMGTDKFGRDIFCRVLYGTRVTLIIALGTVSFGTFFGIVIGAVAGYFGGIADEIISRVIDALFAFPSILMALVMVSVLGTGTVQLVLSLGIAFVPSFARIVRAEYLRARERDYVLNARLQGASPLRIIFVHILPNVKSVLLSSVMIGFNNAVLAEAGLSFLGIGTQPPFASLGQMLSDARASFFTQPLYVWGPGCTIILLVLGFSLIGEGLRK